MSSLTSVVSIFLVIILASLTMLSPVGGSRAFFVFGDSLVDSGNNNFLATTARADSPPYGIDYPDHRPTGRFSNGYNIPDLISLAIGEEPTLAYLDPRLRGQKLLVGANFASAGIGILNDTGFQFVNIIRMHKQFEFFVEYQRRLTAIVGEERTRQLVNGALVLITIGGNDFVNNYFLAPVTARRLQYNIQGFCQLLISELRNILQRMYDLGARRVLVTGIGPLGCVPAELATRSLNGECAFEPQRATAIYNPLLARMIAGLNRQLGNNNTFIAVNAVDKANELIHNPRAYGFVTSNVACCGQGPYNGIGLCTVASSLCRNRSQYVFWDSFHPTEHANKIIVETILNGGERFMSPMNLSTIMMLDSMG